VSARSTPRARAAVLERAGGSLETALAPYRDSVRRLQSVLGCCAAKLCQPGGRKLCTLADMPSTLDVRPKDGAVRLTGPIAIGSTASEIFLLEYAEGLPLNQVAWGRASSPARITPLLRLHRLQFDLIERTPYLAARQGTTLLHEVLAALRAVKPGGAAAASKLIVYVGHDTNLANIGGMLGIHWSLAGYLRDETPPAGALAFELLREGGTGRLFVRLVYYAQTLDQMRRATSLSLARPPARANVSLRGCADVERGGACPWSEFETRARRALDPQCIAVGAR
jgi:4-phytase/acid phosphatase